MVDQKSRKTWGVRVNKKSKLADLVERHLTALKAKGKDVKYIRCDNAGEQQEKLQQVCECFGITLEYTPHTPQYNAVVEL